MKILKKTQTKLFSSSDNHLSDVHILIFFASMFGLMFQQSIPIKLIMAEKTFTVEDAQNLTKPINGFLCPLSANIYNIEFIEFRIRDCTTNTVLFEIKKDQNDHTPVTDESRTVKYHFGPDFFELKTIGTSLTFKVGALPVRDFIMIQRHYFKGKLIKSFNFSINFCIPNTVNSLEAMYEIPDFTQAEKKDMIESPWQTKSDSIYFVDGKLVMHTKAEYSYAPFDYLEEMS